MLFSENRCFEALINLLNVQVQEMKSMSTVIHKLELGKASVLSMLSFIYLHSFVSFYSSCYLLWNIEVHSIINVEDVTMVHSLIFVVCLISSHAILKF